MNLRSGAQQPHISKEIVESSPILIPDDKILGKYYACCEPLIINILNVSVEINELQSLRDYLLPLLMNGQVTIND
jgi:type I restriction enzyme S subunit